MMADFRDMLNLMCLGLSMISKGPQILGQFRRGSSEGIATLSLALETISLSITFSYFSAHGYPLTDFMEYPLLIGQNFILFALLAYYESVLLSRVFFSLGIYSSVVYALSQKLAPTAILGYLSSMVIPMTSMSKLAQIRTIVRTKRGDLVSRLPWAVFASTSAARFYTVLTSSGDKLLLCQYTISVILNILVIIFAWVYTSNEPTLRSKSD